MVCWYHLIIIIIIMILTNGNYYIYIYIANYSMVSMIFTNDLFIPTARSQKRSFGSSEQDSTGSSTLGTLESVLD